MTSQNLVRVGARTRCEFPRKHNVGVMIATHMARLPSEGRPSSNESIERRQKKPQQSATCGSCTATRKQVTSSSGVNEFPLPLMNINIMWVSELPSHMEFTYFYSTCLSLLCLFLRNHAILSFLFTRSRTILTCIKGEPSACFSRSYFSHHWELSLSL